MSWEDLFAALRLAAPAQAAACLHEAGHAVASLVLGAGVVHVQVWVSGGGELTHPSQAWIAPDKAAVVALAGVAAERWRTIDGDIPGDISPDDFDHAWEACGEDNARLDLAWAEAIALVRQQRAAVGAVALALAQRGRLSGGEVAQIAAHLLTRMV